MTKLLPTDLAGKLNGIVRTSKRVDMVEEKAQSPCLEMTMRRSTPSYPLLVAISLVGYRLLRLIDDNHNVMYCRWSMGSTSA
jgi:hypothetical protein